MAAPRLPSRPRAPRRPLRGPGRPRPHTWALVSLAALHLPCPVHGGKDPLITLDEEDFAKIVSNTDRLLVEFHTPWCDHCRQFVPEYRKAGKELRRLGLSTVLSRVDAAAEPELRTQFQIEYYPTFVYIVKGEESERFALHEGNATSSSVVSWIKARELKSSIVVVAEDAIGPMLERLPNGSFALMARMKKHSSMAEAFWKAAKDHLATWDHDVAMLRCIVLWLPNGTQAHENATLHMFRSGFPSPEPLLLEFRGSWDGASIATWARLSSYPTFGSTCDTRRHSAQALSVLGFGGCVAVVLDYSASTVQEEEEYTGPILTRKKMLSVLLPVSVNEPRWYFTSCQARDLDSGAEKMLGSKRTKAPFASVMHWATGKRYVLEGAEEILRPGQVRGMLQKLSSEVHGAPSAGGAAPSEEL